ncbi:hypothetical protein ACFQ9V_20085, partial [Leifsonia sp. NPDC056665]
MEQFDLAVTGARVGSHDRRLKNIGIRGGRVVAVVDEGVDLPSCGAVVEAGGRWVIPGAIDSHSHIGQLAPEYSHLPGFSRDESFAWETRGAVAGGVTTALNYVKFGQGSLLEAFEEAVGAAWRESR